MTQKRVITTEPLAVDYDDEKGFTIAPPGTVCFIEFTVDDGTVDLRTLDGQTIPHVSAEQYEIDR